MIVNIFIPEELYHRKYQADLYGELKIEENLLSYFILSDEPTLSNLRKLGFIKRNTTTQTDDVSIVFSYDNDTTDTTGIVLTNINISFSGSSAHCNIYIYERQLLELLSFNENEKYYKEFDLHFLKTLQCSANKIGKTNEFWILRIHHFIFNLFFLILSILPPAKFIQKLSIFKHIEYYSEYNKDSKKAWSILFDIAMGLVAMYLILVHLNIHKNEPVLEACQYIIFQIRYLLQSLKGTPIGLKLNLQLNNFLLDCFTYHIDLWATFLALISPVIRNLFIPLAFCGILGFSFQLAILSDLLFLTTIHAHCFHIYTAVLYNIEKIGIQVLWKMAIGKRYNTLKNRIETLPQMNRQYYLIALFLACLIFLFPTVFIYYVVFASVRTGIYLCNYLLLFLRKLIVELPVDMFINCIFFRHYDINDVEIRFVKVNQSQPPIITSTVFKLNLKSKFPKKNYLFPSEIVNEINNCIKPKQYFEAIVKGKIVDFS